MAQLIRLYVQIALFRSGPQDIPTSPLLLAITIAVYIAVNSGLSALLLPTKGSWWLTTAVDVMLILIWYLVLMRMARKPERFLQTTTAVFGYQIVLGPLLVLGIWFMRRFDEGSIWQLVLLFPHSALLVWMIMVNARIVKAALEWSISSSAALVILQILVNHFVLTWLLK